MDFFSLRFYFSASHSDSPILGLSDVDQLSIFMCKFNELPPGTSIGQFTLYKQRKYKVIRYSFLRNNIFEVKTYQVCSPKTIIQEKQLRAFNCSTNKPAV